MIKHDVDNYYVGNINFAFVKGNAFVKTISGERMTDDEYRRRTAYYSIISMGAINLSKVHMNDTVTLNNKYNYRSVLTIFYKTGDECYCLHDGRKYKLDNNGDTFCSDLIKLKDLVPKFGYDLPDKISYFRAESVFKNLFKKFNLKYFNDDKFNINDFYIGGLDLCESAEIQGVHRELQIPIQLIMFQQKLFHTAGYSKLETYDGDDIEVDYGMFKSIYLKLDDENYYNINNFKIYNIDSFKAFDDKVKIEKPLKKEQGYMDLEDEVSILKVLKKQKKL